MVPGVFLRMEYRLSSMTAVAEICQMQTLALPKEVEHWSPTTLREKLVMIGAKVVRHGRYVTFQLAEWASEHGQITKIRSSVGCG